MDRVKDIVNTFTELMFNLNNEPLTSGEVIEIVEYITAEQTNWITDSLGWKMLEGFKNFARMQE